MNKSDLSEVSIIQEETPDGTSIEMYRNYNTNSSFGLHNVLIEDNK